MKVSKISIKNYRKFKDTSFEFEDQITSLVGKNNSGKTSLLYLMLKVFGSKEFNFLDFNKDVQNKIIELLLNQKDTEYTNIPKIEVDIYINTPDTTIKNFLVNLDDTKKIHIRFNYYIDVNNQNLRETLKKYTEIEKDKQARIKHFLTKNEVIKNYIKKEYNSISESHTSKEIQPSDFKSVFYTYMIGAKRKTNNDSNKSPLSESITSSTEDSYIETIENAQWKINEELSQIINNDKYWEKTRENINDLIAMEKNYMSLQGNFDNKSINDVIQVLCNELPERFNGLGYSNLIEIAIHINEFALKYSSFLTDNCGGIGLIFIEEPEAFTHPELQYFFIQRLNKILKDKFLNNMPQVIISSHSPHIVASLVNDSKLNGLESIRYVSSTQDSSKIYKILSGKEDSEILKYFIKYLTLPRADLFFADKVIWIEGDSERVLMGKMIEKSSEELMKQNYTILTLGGSHFQILKRLFDIFNIKTLIITDIDYQKDNSEYSPAIKQLYEEYSKDKKALTLDEIFKIEKLDTELWKENIMVTHQYGGKNKENCPRSFEQAFLQENKEYYGIIDKKENIYKQLKKIEDNKEMTMSKVELATDILLSEAGEKLKWKTPEYIAEGLKWLVKNENNNE